MFAFIYKPSFVWPFLSYIFSYPTPYPTSAYRIESLSFGWFPTVALRNTILYFQLELFK
jgi:hypothetical protein